MSRGSASFDRHAASDVAVIGPAATLDAHEPGTFHLHNMVAHDPLAPSHSARQFRLGTPGRLCDGSKQPTTILGNVLAGFHARSRRVEPRHASFASHPHDVVGIQQLQVVAHGSVGNSQRSTYNFHSLPRMRLNVVVNVSAPGVVKNVRARESAEESKPTKPRQAATHHRTCGHPICPRPACGRGGGQHSYESHDHGCRGIAFRGQKGRGNGTLNGGRLRVRIDGSWVTRFIAFGRSQAYLFGHGPNRQADHVNDIHRYGFIRDLKGQEWPGLVLDGDRRRRRRLILVALIW